MSNNTRYYKAAKWLTQLSIGVLLLLPFTGIAQPYGNEWIDFDKNYYKFQVDNEGLHRISYSTLQTIGLPLIGQGFQLYYNGQQMPIFVTTNGTFTANDYIEFYGNENNGLLDTQLYTDPSWHLNNTKSLFAEEATYFLTWHDNDSNSRFETVPNDLSTTTTAETHFVHRIDKILNNQFFEGKPIKIEGQNRYFSDFGNGEGFIGVTINSNNTKSYNFGTTGVYLGEGSSVAQVNLQLVGRSEDAINQPNHHVEIKVNEVEYHEKIYNGYDNELVNFTVDLTDLNEPQTVISLTSLADLSEEDVNAVAFIRLSYPRNFDFDGADFFRFNIANDGDKYIEIANFNGGSAPVLYDLTNNIRLLPTLTGSVYRVLLPQIFSSPSERTIVLSNTTGLLTVTNITSLNEVNFIDYTNPNETANYLIITHPSLTDGTTNQVNRYRNYRTSTNGGGYNVQIAFIDDLYDQFAYGTEKNPLAIRNFINFAVDNWTNNELEYVLLLGRAIEYQNVTYTSSGAAQCLIPSYGDKGSDNMLAARNANSYLPQVAIGRIPARNADDIRYYLDKLEVYDNSRDDYLCAPENLWRKNIISLVQGQDSLEASIRNSFMTSYTERLQGLGLGAQLRGNFVNDDIGIVDFPAIETAFNEGLGMVLYTGDQANDGYWINDVDSPDNYANDGRFPFVLSNCDNTGEIHNFTLTGNEAMATDFVLAQNKGAIAFLANASQAYPNESFVYVNSLIEALTETQYGQAIGNAILYAINNVYIDEPNSNIAYITKMLCQNFTLVGDPAISVVPRNTPEFWIDIAAATYYNPDTGFEILSDPLNITAIMDDFEAKVVVQNLGQAINDSINFNVYRLLNNGNQVAVASKRIATPLYTDTVSVIIPNDMPTFDGFNSFIFYVDADNEITEGCEGNNSFIQGANMSVYCTVDIGPTSMYVLPSDFPIVLDAGEEGLNYEWSTGQSSSSISVSDFGSYSVTVTYAYSCIAVDNININLGTGVETVSVLPYKLYPNPTNNRLCIEGLANAVARLYSSSGLLVQVVPINSNVHYLNLQNCTKGVYLLELIHDKGIVREKIVKQ